jgi:molecular chaperone DnaK
MAAHNKTLGRFELVGIPPAPRGIPQIEVTFDIDANGIVNVSAKDMTTGKEQSVRITASSGLSQEEIDRLVKEAELHAEEDRMKKALIDARNSADSLIYTTEKSLGEAGEGLSPSARTEIDEAIRNLKKAMESEDTSEINRLTEVLTQASHRLAEVMYQKASSPNGKQTQPHDEDAWQESSPGSGDDVIDAEYRDVA